MPEPEAVPGALFAWRQTLDNGLSLGFTGVDAGNLALHTGAERAEALERRRLLEEDMGIRSEALRFMHQTHSKTVIPVTAGDSAEDLPADGMVSPDGATPLAVMVADCLPVLLAGRTGSGTDGSSGWATSAVHAGRVGLLGGILPRAVETLRGSGAREVRAWIGPSICGLCYEVPESMRAQAVDVLPACAGRTRQGTPSLDLPAGALSQLESLGVAAEVVGPCTLEDDRFFSYRGGSHTGRFAGVIWTEGSRGPE